MTYRVETGAYGCAIVNAKGEHLGDYEVADMLTAHEALRQYAYRVVGYLDGLAGDMQHLAPERAETCRAFARELEARCSV